MAFNMKGSAHYGKNLKANSDSNSPNKFLGGLINKIAGKETKLGGALSGKGKMGALLNPLGAIKNKITGGGNMGGAGGMM
tara:strand:+ start:385 stop:624 length:240 start_codon:yes stop_codon:yes gene_type:complete